MSHEAGASANAQGGSWHLTGQRLSPTVAARLLVLDTLGHCPLWGDSALWGGDSALWGAGPRNEEPSRDDTVAEAHGWGQEQENNHETQGPFMCPSELLAEVMEITSANWGVGAGAGKLGRVLLVGSRLLSQAGESWKNPSNTRFLCPANRRS